MTADLVASPPYSRKLILSRSIPSDRVTAANLAGLKGSDRMSGAMRWTRIVDR